MKKINIAFVCDYLEIGGQERKCLNLLSGIHKNLFHPIVYAFRGGAFEKPIRDMGVNLYIGSKKAPLSYRRKWTQQDENEKKNHLKVLGQRMKQDCIDIALIFSWADGVVAANRAQVPVVIEIVDGPRIYDKIRNKSFFDRIICESKAIKNLILMNRKHLQCQKGRINVIYSGIDRKYFDKNSCNPRAERKKLGIKFDDFVFGYVGRVHKVKNLQLLIKTAASLVKDYEVEHFKVVIAGPDLGDLNGLKKLVEENSLEDKVIFVPARTNVAGIFSVLDVFVMTSLIEGVPMSMLEAMAMGLPVVSTNAGSIPEIISKKSFLIDGTDPAVFAKHIRLLMRDSKLRKEMGNESLRSSRNFDLMKSVGEYERIFNESLELKGC